MSRESGSFATATATFTEDEALPDSSAFSAAQGHCGSEILLRSGQHREQVLVALVEKRAGCTPGLHHGNPVLLRHRRDGLGEAGGVGAKHVLDLVLADQALRQGGAAVTPGLVVVIDDVEVVAFVTNLHAAGFPDFLDGERVAIPGMDTVGRVYSSQGDRGPQGNGVAILGGCRIGEQQGRAKCTAQQS